MISLGNQGERESWSTRHTDPVGALLDVGARFRTLVPELKKAIEDLENARGVLGTTLDRQSLRPHAEAFLEAVEKIRALLAEEGTGHG